jgi:hypothetical protein
MAAQIKRFNWVKRLSHWEYAQAWRAHRRVMVQRFQEDATATSAAIVTAQNNLSTGMATLAAQVSIRRAQDALSAKASKVQSQINLLA